MRRLPSLVVPLGLAGLIPFVAIACTILFFPAQVPVPRLVAALIAYGAVILSFLGAVHWGLALAGEAGGVPAPASVDRMRLVLGVLPSLVGWAALLCGLVVVTPIPALLLLVAGFALTVLVEVRASRLGLLPRGYAALRQVLSAVVLLSLLATLVARLA